MGENYRRAGLTPKQVAMLEFAEFLTVSPSSMTQTNVDVLREAGWKDEEQQSISCTLRPCTPIRCVLLKGLA